MEEMNKRKLYSYFSFDKESKFGSVEGMVCSLKSSTYSKEGKEFKKLNFALICNNIDKKVKYILDVEPTVSTRNPDAMFISCVAFGDSAERLEKFLHDNARVIVTGKLSSFEGTSGNKVNLKVQDIFLVKRHGEAKNNYSQSIPESVNPVIHDDEDDDDIPF